LDADSVAQSTAFETPSDFFGLAFMLRTCHGLDDRYIHYLCEGQYEDKGEKRLHLLSIHPVIDEG
jgi:hypothetical protein